MLAARASKSYDNGHVQLGDGRHVISPVLLPATIGVTMNPYKVPLGNDEKARRFKSRRGKKKQRSRPGNPKPSDPSPRSHG